MTTGKYAGNSTNPTRFQHPVAGTYKKERVLKGQNYFSVASGGSTGRTLHLDNMAAGPASYGMTDTMGRMHSDAQLTLFSSFSLGKINKFPLRSLARLLTLFSSFSLGKISKLLLRSLVRRFRHTWR